MSVIGSRKAEIADGTQTGPIEAELTAAEPPAPRSLRRRAGRLLKAITVHSFSSLTRRILVLNLAGLVALVGGIFYLNQFREGLIDARVQALLTQGEIMASAIAASATTGASPIQIDPERLLEQQAAEDAPAPDDAMQPAGVPIWCAVSTPRSSNDSGSTIPAPPTRRTDCSSCGSSSSEAPARTSSSMLPGRRPLAPWRWS